MRIFYFLGLFLQGDSIPIGFFSRRFIFLDFKASWYFPTSSNCHVFWVGRQLPGGPTLCAGSDVIRCYKFIYIYIYNLLSFYKMYLL